MAGAARREESDGTFSQLGPIYREESDGTLTQIGQIYREDSTGTLHKVYDATGNLENFNAFDDSDDCNATTGNTGPAIALDWDNEGLGVNVDNIEILRNTSNSLSGASQIATVAYSEGIGSYRDDSVNEGTTYYYWIQLDMNDGSTQDTTGPAQATTCTGQI